MPIPRLMSGGYPEMLTRHSEDRRRAWVGSYFNMILERDLRDISHIRDLAELPRLLALIASRAGSLLDYFRPQTTLNRYTTLLEVTFLVQTLPAWFTSLGMRIAKSPKVLVNDSGLLLHLLGADVDRLNNDPTLGGTRGSDVLPVLDLKEFARHANIETTLGYVHRGEEKLREQTELLPRSASARRLRTRVRP